MRVFQDGSCRGSRCKQKLWRSRGTGTQAGIRCLEKRLARVQVLSRHGDTGAEENDVKRGGEVAPAYRLPASSSSDLSLAPDDHQHHQHQRLWRRRHIRVLHGDDANGPERGTGLRPPEKGTISFVDGLR